MFDCEHNVAHLEQTDYVICCATCYRWKGVYRKEHHGLYLCA
jgi:hypothetical protein